MRVRSLGGAVSVSDYQVVFNALLFGVAVLAMLPDASDNS